MGDPAGVGPEVIAGAWADPLLTASLDRVVVGRAEYLKRAVALLGLKTTVEVVRSADDARGFRKTGFRCSKWATIRWTLFRRGGTRQRGARRRSGPFGGQPNWPWQTRSMEL